MSSRSSARGRGARLLALLLALLAVTAACAPSAERELDTAEEARRARILETRAASPIAVVGDDDLALLDALLLWRSRWDEAANDALAALTSGDPEAADAAADRLEGLVAALAAIPTDGTDTAVRDWVATIVAGYEAQAAALRALGEVTAIGGDIPAAQAEVRAAYAETAQVEATLLREVAEWVNEAGPRTRQRLHDIADAIEREGGATG